MHYKAHAYAGFESHQPIDVINSTALNKIQCMPQTNLSVIMQRLKGVRFKFVYSIGILVNEILNNKYRHPPPKKKMIRFDW